MAKYIQTKTRDEKLYSLKLPFKNDYWDLHSIDSVCGLVVSFIIIIIDILGSILDS